MRGARPRGSTNEAPYDGTELRELDGHVLPPSSGCPRGTGACSPGGTRTTSRTSRAPIDSYVLLAPFLGRRVVDPRTIALVGGWLDAAVLA